MSDSRFMYEAHYGLLRRVVDKEFGRTLTLWYQDCIQLKTDKDELLKVLALEHEAKRLNIQDIQEYIAVRIERSQPTVSRLLELISLAYTHNELTISEYLGDNVAFIGDGEEISWKPSRKEIERKKKSIPRICAGSFDGCKGESGNGALPLCKPCHQKALSQYGSSFMFPDWLQSEINRIRREHYELVKDACYKDYYGTASIEETEHYLDAA